MSALFTLIKRDVRLALKGGGHAGLALGFFVLVAGLLPLAVGSDFGTLRPLAPGFVWLAALLAVLLTLDGVFQSDYEDGTLDQLVVLGPALELQVLARGIAHWLVTGLPVVIVGPIIAMAFTVPADQAWVLGLSLALGTPALTFIGLIGAALSLGVRRGGLLLGIITLPLYVPVLIFGANVGRPEALMLLALISLFALLVGAIAAAAAIRLHLE